MSRLLADGSLGARMTGLLALIKTPEAMEGYLLRARVRAMPSRRLLGRRSLLEEKQWRRAQHCITAVQEASRLAAGRGWLS